MPSGFARCAGVDEAAWWAKDDPVPFVAMVSSLAPLAIGYGARRRRRAPWAARDVAGSYLPPQPAALSAPETCR